jgi:hypothetical protein
MVSLQKFGLHSYLVKTIHTIFSYLRSRTKKDRNDRLANEIVRVRDEYITNEVRMRRTEAQATNAKLKKVMDMWIGNKIEELFQGWKGIMIRSKIERENIRILHEKERQRMDQEENQKITVAKQEVSSKS